MFGNVERIIVGLGNPGPKYKNTRHNVGFLFCDFVYDAWLFNGGWRHTKFGGQVVSESVSQGRILLLKPQLFMNLSGQALFSFFKYNRLSFSDYELFVVYDDLDLKLGQYKISPDKTPKSHNGVQNIKDYLGSDFVSVRVGIDNRKDDTGRANGEDYVLGNFSSDEFGVLEGVFSEVLDGVNNMNQNNL